MMTEVIERITLPTGLWVDGVCHKEAQVRSLTGSDEVFLLEAGQNLLPAQRTTALLARCLTQLGPPASEKTEALRALTVGDREAILLHVRRLTMGERLQSAVTCPNPDCQERMDLELNVEDLLLPPYENCREWYQEAITDDGKTYQLCFRLPTGGDQEVVAELARCDTAAAVEELFRRCIRSASDSNEDINEGLPRDVFAQLSKLMSELDPQAELILNTTCPACSHSFSTQLDFAHYFFQELSDRIRHVYREVHQLAFYYHWAEKEIMTMTPTRRRIYLGLLAEEMSEKTRR